MTDMTVAQVEALTADWKNPHAKAAKYRHHGLAVPVELAVECENTPEQIIVVGGHDGALGSSGV